MAQGLNGTLFSTGISKASAFQFLAHGTLGGIMSVAHGGNFGSGFLSGGVASLTGGLGNRLFGGSFIGTTLSGGFAGGLASAVAGGNFWDGFRNGAISAGLNHGLHKLTQDIRPRRIDFSKKSEYVLKQVTKWARYIRNNPDADVYLSDIVKHYRPERGLFDMLSDGIGASSTLSEKTYIHSNGDMVKLGYVTDYYFKGISNDTKIQDIWFKGQIGNSNRYDIGFVGNSVSGGNPPTLFYLNFIGENFYNHVKSQILN